ncbi:MAG TPA: SDR family NAD(P)-dependent oxidoreductase [Thermoanaerobaculia bacterium]|jgi:acyl transferase domain-containing protein|nr:SDR family NAD(P)-dependent oxidoreductase [Thermoanaerobaculia bacterium]
MRDEQQMDGIAIIGMACRFPDAQSPEDLWRNLCDGVESITRLSDEELRAGGVSPELLAHPAYVKAASMLAGIDQFDAGFFGLNPREAELTDPQQRLFLECSWEALENAGYDAAVCAGRIGVYAGSRLNMYLLENIYPQRASIRNIDPLQVLIGNDKDYLATQVSYRLGLTGPSLGIQTACSTALVAVSLACQGLFSYQCDMALAGAVSVRIPQAEGYLFQEGGICSPDGHCRAFDARAQGTVFGSGLGVVVLKRLEDAVRDGDTIRAVIRGWAVNNDGADKVGYTAPGQAGQADVIAMAQALAGVSPETIGLVEAHGTGTPLGDPVEVAALEEVFRAGTHRRGFCALGSVKTNLGHLDTAAGVAGLIKAVLAVEHGQIPPILHFEQPNPRIDLAASPFYVNARLSDWLPEPGTPRRAGVSSFGVGGTNAHLVLEEAPPALPGAPSRSAQLLVLSARSAGALDKATANLARHFQLHPEVDLADAACTLQTGRRGFPHRRMVVVRDRLDAVEALTGLDPRRVVTGVQPHRDRPVAFLFPGQGAQYPNMGLELYREEPVFREHLDRCCDLLLPWLQTDLRPLLYPAAGEEAMAAERLAETDVTQPALFAVEHALAQLWMAWGVRPKAMAGHSVGEYVAACLAGVLSLEDAARLVAARARLMQEMPPGAMLSVPLPEAELRPRLGDGLALAAVNGPALCAVAGTPEEVELLERRLAEEGVACRRLHTSRAFHSAMMEPILARFAAEVGNVRLSPPRIPYLSNLSGGWITAAEATSRDYWVRHLRQTVRFGDNLQALLADPGVTLLEVGPGTALGSLAMRHPARAAGQEVLSSMRHPADSRSGMAVLLEALGGLWLAGAHVDWSGLYGRERRRRIPLPTYPFERERYWIDKIDRIEASQPGGAASAPAAGFSVPVWKQTPAPLPWRPEEGAGAGKRCLLFMDEAGLAAGIARRLGDAGREVIKVFAGSAFARLGVGEYTLVPGDAGGYGALLACLKAEHRVPDTIFHCWCVTGSRDVLPEHVQDRGFFSLLFLAQALGEHGIGIGTGAPLRLAVLSDGMHRIGGESRLQPAKATVLGPCRVIPQEYPNILCSSLDVVLPEPGAGLARLVDQLLGELAGQPGLVAYRGNLRWSQTLEPASLEGPAGLPRRLRPEGVYLITGGLGGIGLVLAEHLVQMARAKLVLTGRSYFPERTEWDRWLKAKGPDGEVSRKILHLRRLEESGGEILTVRADVTSLPQMQEAVERAHARFGKIHGVIHAAGLPGGGVIQLKTREAASEVLAPKVAGTLVLDALLSDEPLDFLLLCSSTFALQGGVGRVDYCAANAFLDVYARHCDGSGAGYTVAVDWDGWAEVGMAARDVAEPSRVRREVPIAPEPSTPVDHPLLDRRLRDTPAAMAFRTGLDASKDWVLAEHRLMDTPVPPGAALVEMMRAAAAEALGRGKLQLRDVTFLTPLWVPDGEVREVHTVLSPGKGSWSARVVTQAGTGEAAPAWKEHATASVFRTSRPAHRVSLDKIAARCSKVQTFEPGQTWRAGSLGFWGPRWSCLRRLDIGADEGLATLELPEPYKGDLERLWLHPALLDVATACGLALAGDGFFLPLFYGSLTCHGPLPGRFYSHFRLRGETGEDILQFDVSLLDAEGVELVTIEEFTLKRVEEAALDGARDEPGVAVNAIAPSPARLLGISSAEGAEALSLILDHCTWPQIVVRARHAAVPETFAPAAERGGDAALPDAHGRPDLKTPYVAPRNEIERALAGIWEQALGFDQIGIYDNFFQLGGHSVVAIQLISRIREELEIELSLNVLFEANTIADLAAVAVRILSEQAGTEDLSDVLAELEGLSDEEALVLTGSPAGSLP